MKQQRNNYISKIYRQETINKIQRKIDLLGLYKNYNPLDLLNYRLLITLITFFGLLITKQGFILGPFIAILFYIISEYLFLDFRIERRRKKLNNEALFYFEVLALTLESGRNLKAALEMTSINIDSELSAEFSKSLNEIKMGKTLTESLTTMKNRIPSDTINNVILNINQSSVFGNSIIDSLYNQINFLRDKKISEVKGQINKIPVKISAISVVFFVPIMLLIILGPILLKIIATK